MMNDGQNVLEWTKWRLGISRVCMDDVILFGVFFLICTILGSYRCNVFDAFTETSLSVIRMRP